MAGSLTAIKNESKIITVNSLIIAIFLTSSFIARIFASLGIVEEGLLPVIILGAPIVSYMIAFFYNQKLKINGSIILLICFIFIFLFISVLIGGVDSFAFQYLVDFIAYGLIGSL